MDRLGMCMNTLRAWRNNRLTLVGIFWPNDASRNICEARARRCKDLRAQSIEKPKRHRPILAFGPPCRNSSVTLCHRTKLNSKTNSRIKLTAQSLALDKMHLGLTARMLPSIFSGAIAGGNFGRRGLGSRHFIRSVAGVWRKGRQRRPSRRIPDGRGRYPPANVPRDLEPDRRTTPQPPPASA